MALKVIAALFFLTIITYPTFVKTFGIGPWISSGCGIGSCIYEIIYEITTCDGCGDIFGGYGCIFGPIICGAIINTNCLTPAIWGHDCNLTLEDEHKWPQVDACYRNHEQCTHMKGYEIKNDLENNSPYKRFHCDCENQFRDCLMNVKGIMANAIRREYFRFQDYCFKQDYPILHCHKFVNYYNQTRCVYYQLDESKPKKWQWFNNAFW